MLSNNDFKVVYATGETEPVEFFFEALLESKNFDLGLGFFNSSGFRSLSLGFAYFIYKGGKMRIIINDLLWEEDKKAIEKGYTEDTSKLIEEKVVKDVVLLSKTLSSHDKHFFNCISWLIGSKKLDLIAVVPVGKNPGIAHQKFGIFKDDFGNAVAFTGSINFSTTAYYNNLEAISCYKSWTNDKSDRDRIEYYQTLFNKIWTGNSTASQIISLEKVKTIIRENFPVQSLNELLQEEKQLIDEINAINILPENITKKYNALIIKETSRKTLYSSGFSSREYQDKAVERWFENSCQGLFEMATGTGKTMTGLYASTKLFHKLGSLVVLVLVPTLSLAEQWGEEVKRFNYKEITIVSSENIGWVNQLQSSINSFKLGTLSNFVIISTYDSYKSKKFQEFYTKLPEETLLIADEAHSMGAPDLLKKLPHQIKFRLALSATPHRHFDDSGTQKLLDFFNASLKSTFTFGMKEAIANRYLCQYKLFPKFGELSDDEYEKYIKLTKEISKRAHIVKNKFNESDIKLERMLQERRKILNRASSKIQILGNIIDQLRTQGEIHHTLVYCPEGNDEEEDNRIIDEYGKYLAFEKGLRIGQFTGTTSIERRTQLLKQFDEGTIQCLLAMKCLDEGVDVKRTETAIFISSSTNPRQYVQRRGRVLRVHEEKSFAFLYDIIAIPPKLENDDPKIKEVEKIILKQEFKRYKEFAEDAMNYVEAITPIKNLCKEYKIDF